jgi:hypothetical protein
MTLTLPPLSLSSSSSSLLCLVTLAPPALLLPPLYQSLTTPFLPPLPHRCFVFPPSLLSPHSPPLSCR